MNGERELKSVSRVTSWNRLHEDKTFGSGPDIVWPTLESDAEYEWIEYSKKVFLHPNMQHTLFREIDFDQCVFVSPSFKNLSFENCTFRGCELSSGVFASCRFSECRLAGCSLSHVMFLDSELSVEVDGDTNLVGVSGVGTTLISESLTLENFAALEGETMSHTIVKRVVAE